jgi:hypothetical protein
MTALHPTAGASSSSTAATPLVLVGPRTRLGRRLAEQHTGPVLPVSRGADDDADLSLPALAVDGSGVAAALVGAPAVELALCALGPVHPGPVDLERDAASVRRDLDFVAAVLSAADGRPVRVVLVSSVVALAPGPDRRYYGGAKAQVEQMLVSLLADHPAASLDVLYPGRIVDVDERTRPWHRLHADFARVAALVQKALHVGSARRRVVGLDARLWLGARALSLVVSGLRAGHVNLVLELPTKR